MGREQKRWILYLILAVVAAAAWFRFSYQSFSFINLSVSKPQALSSAQTYLSKQLHVDPTPYRHAVVLVSENAADRYLQKTIGFPGELKFLHENHFSLFAWRVRFFKEEVKEEYNVTIDASTGKITGLGHTIDDTAFRPDKGLESAFQTARQFFSKEFNINFDDYLLKERSTKKYDHRSDYSFSWQKKDISIPWNAKAGAGTGKLLIKARMSGDEILYYDAKVFDVPDDFRRFIDNEKQAGSILTNIFMLLSYLLIALATYFLITKRQNMVLQMTQSFYVRTGIFLFFALLLFQINNIQDILCDYPTTSTLSVYFSELFIGALISGVFLAVIMIIPAMAGEALAQENTSPPKAFSYYIQTTFLSRHAALMVLLGYILAVILLGLQSVVFHIGQAYGGVWAERPHITQASSALWPFLTVFIIGARASLCEETLYRFFGIEYFKKAFKNIFLACLLTSIIWGFGHSHYQIFPSWFRGVEVCLLGLVLSFFYIQYGIIPVVVGHYVFDTFWGGAGFVLGRSQSFDLFTCLAVILLPLLLAIAAFICNKTELRKPGSFLLKKSHRYNIQVLKSFLSDPRNMNKKDYAQIRQELIDNGWDALIVDEAIKETSNGA